MNYKFRLFLSTRKLHLGATDKPDTYLCGIPHRLNHQIIFPGKKGIVYAFITRNKICKPCLRKLLDTALRRFKTTPDLIKISGPGEGTERMIKLVNRLRGKRRHNARTK